MPSFSYTARDTRGEVVRGRLDAGTRKLALRQLSGRGLVPVRLEEGGGGSDTGPVAGGDGATTVLARLNALTGDGGTAGVASAKLTRKQRLPFLRALSELVGCGVQTGDAVRMLARRLSAGPQKALASAMWLDLSQGRSLSAALRAHTKVFDEASISLIEAGEATGNLAEILRRLVGDLENREEMKSKLTAALAYPVFIMLVAVAVVMIFLFVLLPRIQTLLTGLGGKLPFATRLLIGFSEFLVTGGPVILIGGLLAGVSLWSWRRTPKGRETIDQRVLGVPGLGTFLRDADLLRLVQTLALLLENGITTIAALALTERTILNTTLRRAFAEARLKISEGLAIAAALRDTGYFPDLVTDIMLIGENTGNIVPSLQEVTRFYQRRQTKQLNLFVGVLSIGVLLLAFAFVALIAFGIILAVFSMSSNLRTR
jgi:type II secretory pathway component PulF